MNLEKTLFPQAEKDKTQKPSEKDESESSSDSECVKHELDVEPKKKTLDEANQEIKDQTQLIVKKSDSEEVQSSLEKLKSSEIQLEYKSDEVTQELIKLQEKHREIARRVQNVLIETVNLTLGNDDTERLRLKSLKKKKKLADLKQL